MVLENKIEKMKGLYEKYSKRTLVSGITGLAAGIGLFTSLYIVPADSVGVVQFLGKYNRTERPGIHMKIPMGLETVICVPTEKVQKEEFGFRTLKAGVNSTYLNPETLAKGGVSESDLKSFIEKSLGKGKAPDDKKLITTAFEILQSEYLTLTGDLYLADVEWTVQYQITNPKDYLFNVQDPIATLRDASISTMKELMGNGSIDEAITIGRENYETQGKQKLQELLNGYQAGIRIVAIKLQSSDPPQRVRPAYDGVNQAMQQKETRINNARQEYNKLVEEAKGNANKKIEVAEGYAIKRINEARGDANRFTATLIEYQKAPEVTRQRMYFETMENVLPKMTEKILIDGIDKGNLMNLLNLKPDVQYRGSENAKK